MKMNENTWHGHIISTYTDSRPQYIENLCPYVRKVIKGCFNILGIIIAISFFTFLLGGGTLATMHAMITMGIGNGFHFIMTNVAFYGIGFFFTALLMFAIGGTLIYEMVWTPFIDYRRDQRRAKLVAKRAAAHRGEIEFEEIEEKPSLIMAWLRAKHDKICPKLEW